ncbi:ferredoxin [Candidatus Woesearchaeota archaeon]|nr:ferredoxin [Candidatus Woesearchaeota archaeon]
MPKIVVDTDACIGCGACSALAPELFELDDDNKAHTKKTEDLNEEDLKKAQECVEICPVQVIKLE